MGSSDSVITSRETGIPDGLAAIVDFHSYPCLYKCESHRRLVPQALAPNIKGLFCSLLLLAKLFHREAAALMCVHPFTPVFFLLVDFPIMPGYPQ
jgi:hypothetical protein